jgi:hypothetical protein
MRKKVWKMRCECEMRCESGAMRGAWPKVRMRMRKTFRTTIPDQHDNRRVQIGHAWWTTNITSLKKTLWEVSVRSYWRQWINLDYSQEKNNVHPYLKSMFDPGGYITLKWLVWVPVNIPNPQSLTTDYSLQIWMCVKKGQSWDRVILYFKWIGGFTT